jgi:hypothetical protein
VSFDRAPCVDAKEIGSSALLLGPTLPGNTRLVAHAHDRFMLRTCRLPRRAIFVGNWPTRTHFCRAIMHVGLVVMRRKTGVRAKLMAIKMQLRKDFAQTHPEVRSLGEANAKRASELLRALSGDHPRIAGYEVRRLWLKVAQAAQSECTLLLGEGASSRQSSRCTPLSPLCRQNPGRNPVRWQRSPGSVRREQTSSLSATTPREGTDDAKPTHSADICRHERSAFAARLVKDCPGVLEISVVEALSKRDDFAPRLLCPGAVRTLRG